MATHRTARFSWTLLVVLASATLFGCKNESLYSDRCAEKEVRECDCPGGKVSTQTCGKKGWGACVCQDVPGPDAGGAGTTGGADSGSAGSGGMSGSGDEDDSGTPGGTAGDSGGTDAGPDAATGTDAGPDPDPYSECTSDNDCAKDDKCTMAGTKKYCARPCTMSTDCPAAKSGTAVPTCPLTGMKLCQLNCPALTMCPTGMACNIIAGSCEF